MSDPGSGFGFYPFQWGDEQLDPGESILVTYSKIQQHKIIILMSFFDHP